MFKLKPKKIIAIIAVGATLVTALAGCSKDKPDAQPDNVAIANFTKPVNGEKIGVISVKGYGDIKIKFFPEYAAKGVENFQGLSDMGYYDELIFHRVIENFCIQGGDPKGNGTGGTSLWGEEFDFETSDSLRNFSGAVAYAHSQDGKNGSQFYILTGDPADITDEVLKGYNFPQNVLDKYKEVGGAPNLDGGYTVFGQVFEGMDIVHEIEKVEVSSEKPIDQVLMEKVRIVDFEG